MKFYKGEILKNLGLLPDMVADEFGSRTVYIYRDVRQSFEGLSRRSSRFASSLVESGVEQGDKVALYLPNTIQFPEAFFGVIKTGAVPVPLNLRIPPRTLSYVIEDSGAKTLVASDLESSVSSPERAEELFESTDIEQMIIPGKSGDGVSDYEKLVEEGCATFGHANQDFEDTAILMYTSGTTGKPKGVPLSHENILSTVEGFGRASFSDSSSRQLLVLPLYHIYGLSALLCNYTYYGASTVLQAEPDPGKLLKNIAKHDVTSMAGVPALFRMMWLVYGQEPEEYDLDSLEEVVCAAAPLDETTRRKVKDEWEVRFGEGWGMTETSPCGCLNPGRVPKAAGCIGWPVQNIQFKLVDPESRETLVPWGEIGPYGDLKDEHVDVEGEAAVKGPAVFKGYYKMPEKNEEVFDEDGWFYTGDLMKIDKDKALWMLDRTDDMILSGGENIYPSEVEDALLEHDEINDAAVVPAPHKTKGEAPVAFVVLGEGSELGEEEIKEFALERVPTYAHPRRVFFKNNLPKSGTLKTQHFKLEEEAKELIETPLGEL